MAFASIFIAFLLVIMLVFAAVFLLGAIITIIALIRRKKAKKQGKAPKRAGLIAGIIIMLLPIVTLAGLFVYSKLNGGNSSYERAKQYRDTVVMGIEKKDADMIYSAFSQNTKETDTELLSEIENMLEFIDGDLKFESTTLPSESCEKYDEDGMFEIITFNGSMMDAKTDKNRSYRIYYSGYSQDDDHPEKLGIDNITVCDNDQSKKIEVGIIKD